MSRENTQLLLEIFLTMLTTFVVPWALRAYQARTGVQVTDQQRQAIYSAINTAAGIVIARRNQGSFGSMAITPDHPAVQAEAAAALATVPDAAAAQGASREMAARKIVAIVAASPQPPPEITR